MDTGGAERNPYAAPQVAVDQAEPRPADLEGFRSLTPLAQVIVALLALGILLHALAALNSFVAISAMRRVIAHQPYEIKELTAIDQRSRIAALALFVVSTATFVIFCFLVPRANRNVRSFGVGPLEFTPRGAVGYMFVPVVNFYAPYQAVKEIWLGSALHVEVLPSHERVPPLLPWWWGMYLVGSVAAGAIGGVFARAHGPEQFISKCQADIVRSALTAVSAVLFAAVVRGLAARQDARQRARVTVGASP